MSATKYAAGRDFGFWIDINGALQVFGDLWTYNLPKIDGTAPLNNTAVAVLEEPEIGGVRPASGGFMLGDQGQIIGIGDYDLHYWENNPTPQPPEYVPPNILIPDTVPGHIDIATSSQMGAWALDSTGTPQLVYISPLATNFTAISSGTFPRPKPAGSGYISIAAGRQNVYLLDASGQITTFGFGTAPEPLYPPTEDGIFTKVVASTTHAASISDQGKILWWPEDPADTDTIASIQTPPLDKGYTDVAVGPGYSYALTPSIGPSHPVPPLEWDTGRWGINTWG